MARVMVTAMLLMVAAFWLYSAAVALARVRGIIAEREPGAVPKIGGQMGSGPMGGGPMVDTQPGAPASGTRRGTRTEAP